MVIVQWILLALGLAALGAGLLLTLFIDITGVRNIWANFTMFAPLALALSGVAAAGGLFLLIRREALGWAVLGLALGSGLMVLVQMPIIQAGSMAQSWQEALDAGFGPGWQDGIPAEVSQYFLPSATSSSDLEPARPLREQLLTFATTSDGTDLPMQVYRPDDDATYPAVISIHGGGWLGGGLGEGETLNRYLAAQGYVVLDITYRYSELEDGIENFYPIPMADVRCAIGYAKTQAADLGLDPDRMALMGRSAGGHMALLSAYAGPDLVEPTCETGGDYSVQAVVGFYSPTDLEVWVDHGGGNVTEMVGSFLGDLEASGIDAVYEVTSAVRQVTPDDPPTLLIDGARDIAVPSEQHNMLYEALQAAGVPSALLRIPWATHVFDETYPTGPGNVASAWAVERFLAWRLY